VEGNVLHVEALEIVDGTPLLDIKPYIRGVDARQRVTIGWLEGSADANPHRCGDDGLAD